MKLPFGIGATAAFVSLLLACASVLAATEDHGAAGRELAFDRAKGNCLACHTMKGSDVPSTVGPPLVDIKAKFPDRKVLYGILYDEETRNPQTVMPAFGKNLILSSKDINEIIDFLYTQ